MPQGGTRQAHTLASELRSAQVTFCGGGATLPCPKRQGNHYVSATPLGPDADSHLPQMSMWSWPSRASIVARYVISDIPIWAMTLAFDRYRVELSNRDCLADEKYLSMTGRFL